MSAPDPIAVVPAAGFGTRLGATTGTSKEVALLPDVDGRERPAIEHLFDRLVLGGVRRAVVVTRREKQDLRVALEARPRADLEVDIRLTAPTPSSVHTLAVALRSEPGATWVLGYPDILFHPRDAIAAIVARLRSDRLDLCLGLFPSDRPEKTDMVATDEDGRVVDLRIKQPDIGLRHTWSVACWGPRFTGRLLAAAGDGGRDRELFVGDVVRSCLQPDSGAPRADAALGVGTVTFPAGFALDIGTPEDLERARRRGADTPTG